MLRIHTVLIIKSHSQLKKLNIFWTTHAIDSFLGIHQWTWRYRKFFSPPKRTSPALTSIIFDISSLLSFFACIFAPNSVRIHLGMDTKHQNNAIVQKKSEWMFNNRSWRTLLLRFSINKWYILQNQWCGFPRNHNDLLRFRFRLCKSFGSGSGSRQYLAVFQKATIAQNLAFSMSESAYFPESWPPIFIF